MASQIQDKQDLLSALVAHQSQILEYGVNRLGVFGSFVRNQAHSNSDVDFFVEFEPSKKNFKNFMKLADLLEDITGRTVELVTPQSLNKHIGKYILEEVEYISFAA